MKQSHLKTVSSEKKTPPVTRFRRAKGLNVRISKSKANGNSGVEVKGPSIMMTDERNSHNQPPKFKAARRAAICSVMEEEDERHGFSLAELRMSDRNGGNLSNEKDRSEFAAALQSYSPHV
ncbi:hypothetical protein ACROYT_G020898 [Oculina patagonica]